MNQGESVLAMDGSRARARRSIWRVAGVLWLVASAILIYLLKDAPRGESLLELVSFSLGVAAGAIAALAFLLWICWWLFYRLPVKLMRRWGKSQKAG